MKLLLSLLSIISIAPLTFGQKTTDSLHTIAGDLVTLEIETGCKYNVLLDGKIVLHTDCNDDSNKYNSAPEPTIHTYYKSIASEGVGEFSEVVLFEMFMMGNACNGSGFIFLGLKTDKSYVLSNDVDFCGGRQPVITWAKDKVTLFIPGGPPNRGKGYIPPETWIYEKGFVRKVARASRRQ